MFLNILQCSTSFHMCIECTWLFLWAFSSHWDWALIASHSTHNKWIWLHFGRYLAIVSKLDARKYVCAACSWLHAKKLHWHLLTPLNEQSNNYYWTHCAAGCQDFGKGNTGHLYKKPQQVAESHSDSSSMYAPKEHSYSPNKGRTQSAAYLIKINYVHTT